MHGQPNGMITGGLPWRWRYTVRLPATALSSRELEACAAHRVAVGDELAHHFNSIPGEHSTLQAGRAWQRQEMSATCVVINSPEQQVQRRRLCCRLPQHGTLAAPPPPTHQNSSITPCARLRSSMGSRCAAAAAASQLPCGPPSAAPARWGLHSVVKRVSSLQIDGGKEDTNRQVRQRRSNSRQWLCKL